MTGKPLFNFPEFDRVRDLWKLFGWTVVSPADMNRENGFDPSNPYLEPPTLTKEFQEEALRRDVEALLDVNAVVMLDGWQHSTGARAEYCIARWRHIPVYDERGNFIPSLFDGLKPAKDDDDPKAVEGSKKCPMDLLPPIALLHTAWVLGHGAEKYGPWNWRTSGIKQSTYVAAMLRHIMAMHSGAWEDADSGIPHAAHIAASCAILMDAEIAGKLER